MPAGVLPSDIFVENGTPVGHGMDFINIEVRSDVPDTGAFWMFPLALAPVLYFGRRLRAPA